MMMIEPTEIQQEIVASFRNFIEDSCAHDDRYGHVSRSDSEDGTVQATRFEVDECCWLEAAVIPDVTQIRVSFITSDRTIYEEIEESIEASGTSPQQLVQAMFAEAGLDWKDPPVERSQGGESSYGFATVWPLEDLQDLEQDAVRNRVLRMLEGYMLAFVPATILEDDEEEND
jgi:hypothetical protein